MNAWNTDWGGRIRKASRIVPHIGCPLCGVDASQPCRTWRGLPYQAVHWQRQKAFRSLGRFGAALESFRVTPLE